MKSTPAKVILVHGTWGRGFNPESKSLRTQAAPAEPRWFEMGSKFYSALASALAGLVTAADLNSFPWSGANSIEERRSAATRLARILDDSVAAAPDVPHFIIAHSHGGNLALDAREAMLGSPFNVHILTMATPFLSIYRAVPRIIDRLFVICLSLGAAAFAGYLLIAWTFASNIFLYVPWLLSLLSIIFGIITFCVWVYRALLATQRPSRRSRTLEFARRINNHTLLVSSIIFAASWLSFGRNSAGIFGSTDSHDANFALFALLLLGGAVVVLPVIIPSLLVFFASRSIAGNILYGPQYESPKISRVSSNLKILRSRRDEATLTLLFGKLASFLTHIAASISMIIPIAAASIVVFFSYIAMKYLLSAVQSHSECLASLTPDCVNQQLRALIVSVSMNDSVGKISHYVAFGLGMSVFLVLLAVSCKSFFGRELFYRSLNAAVDVSDTPGGSSSYKVHWCAPSEGGLLSLRHSLYNNPDALKAIVAYIEQACTTKEPLDDVTAGELPSVARKNEIWRNAVAFAAVGCIYAVTTSIAYAPSGARSIRCSLVSYFEPSAAAGGFTVLVAGFEGDFEGVGDRFAKTMAQQYGFPVIQTCLQVSTSAATGKRGSSFGEGSAAWLLRRHNSDLILWGKVTDEKRVELHVWHRGPFRDPSIQTELKPADVATFVATKLQSDLVHAIEYSARETSSSNPPPILAKYADQVDALAQSIDRNANELGASARLEGPLRDFLRLRDTIGIHVASGRLMKTAATASNDGQRAKKAVAHFERASAMWDGAGKNKSSLSNDWKRDESAALLLDAQLNKNKVSAKLVASRYLADYEEARKNLNYLNYQLAEYAQRAASAASEASAITGDRDSTSASIRLACESLLLLRYWQDDKKEIQKHNLELARQSRMGAVLPDTPPPEQSEAYQSLDRLKKNPSSIVARGRRMKLKDCESL
ncbi:MULTISPECIES: esterase/lipase family protein [unclassified Bradyrhizobium]|uniref:esterase/lipase family protein n=1 Tax=unclassified Bradyrhizobium TaxID=2631580 RepID=UPI002305028E|nr:MULTISPECIES: hypothetical protein [unclassified Bradyrhizobium]